MSFELSLLQIIGESPGGKTRIQKIVTHERKESEMSVCRFGILSEHAIFVSDFHEKQRVGMTSFDFNDLLFQWSEFCFRITAVLFRRTLQKQ